MKYMAVICFVACFCVRGFSLTIDELQNLDSAKVATMPLPELFDANKNIKEQMNKALSGNRYWDNAKGGFVTTPVDSREVGKLRTLKSIVQSQLIHELENLDTASVATMNLPELQEAKNMIDQQIYELLNDRFSHGVLSTSLAHLQAINKWHTVEAIVQPRIDYLHFRDYNAFDRLGSFHEYSGIVTLILGVGGLATTIIVPASTSKFGWWILPSGAFSIVAIHLGITEIELGLDLKGYGARVTIPVK